MKKTGLDKTSIVMITVFCVLIVASAAGLIFNAVNQKNEAETDETNILDVENVEGAGEGQLTVEDILEIVPGAQPGSTYSYFDDDGNLKSVTIPENTDTSSVSADLTDKYKFTEYADLSDKFLEVCRAGNVEELYKLYYSDFLEQGRQSMDPVPTKEVFDAGLKSDMMTVTGFDEYEYGCVELPPTQSAGAYAAQIYYNAYGASLPIPTSDIENCVNLVVYIENMYQTNHFMVQIDGYWYFIV